MDRIARLEVARTGIVRYNPEVEKERAVAIYDLLQENRFCLRGAAPGPYAVTLALRDQSLMLDIQNEAGAALGRVTLPLSSLRKTIKDYFTVCDSYYAAIKTSSLAQIEAIDMGRRGLHSEGAEELRERLADRVEMDAPTARRLFTLLCVLHLRG